MLIIRFTTWAHLRGELNMNLSIDMINEKLNLKTQIYTYQNSVPILERPRLFQKTAKLIIAKFCMLVMLRLLIKQTLLIPGPVLSVLGHQNGFPQ